MKPAARPDLEGMRRNVTRIALVQGALVAALAAYLLAGPQSATSDWRPIAWMGALPLGLWAAAFYQYRAIAGAMARDAYTREFGKDVTATTVKALGVGFILWLAVLVTLLFL